MRLFLINICPADVFYSPSILCLYSYTKAHISDIAIECIVGWDSKDFSKVTDFSPDIIGISAMTPHYEDATFVAIRLKELLPNVPIIIGGVHITILPRSIRKCFDIGVVGEGEETLCELLDLYKEKKQYLKNDLINIDGIVFWDDASIVTTKSRRPLDLSNYPLIDYSIVPKEKFRIKEINAWGRFGVEGLIEASRGCPFSCIFCAARVVWKKIRYFPIEWIVGNLKNLIKQGCTHIHLTDELFAINKNRLRKLIEEFKKHEIQKIVQFSVNARTSIFDEELCDILKDVGVTSVFFGFESNNHRVLQMLKGESCGKDDNCNAVKICYKSGMECWGAIMMGAPTETEEEINDTIAFIEWCKKYKVRRICIGTLIPYPGTPIWDIAEKRGLVSCDNFVQFKTVINAVDDPLVADCEVRKNYKKIRKRALKAAHSFKWGKAWSLFKDNPLLTIKVIAKAPWWLIKRQFDSTMP